MNEPRVTLLSWPKNCRELLFVIWHVAHSGQDVLSPEEIADRCRRDPVLDKEVEETFQKIVFNEIPVSENAWFVFLLENITISLRDQICRHRIGSKLGDVTAVDVIPNVADGTQWVRGSRIEPMKAFADEGRYRVPEIVRDKGLMDVVDKAMKGSQDAYNELLAAGVPIEEAREVIPLGAQNRMSWGCNLTAIRHVCARRTCWIAQGSLWHPIVQGMSRELAEKVHPMFNHLADPPCFDKQGNWNGCSFHLENGERIKGNDVLIPCSLYLKKHQNEAREAASEAVRDKGSSAWEYSWAEKGFVAPDHDTHEKYERVKKRFGDLWGRNPETGERTGDDTDALENHGTTPEAV